METIFNFSKMRCKKLHWMTEVHIWKWFIPHIDAFKHLQPIHCVQTGDLYALLWRVNFGFGVSIEPQGPPNE